MGSVPILPTIMLSSMFTKFVIPVCTMIGKAIIIVSFMKYLSKTDLRIFIIYELTKRTCRSILPPPARISARVSVRKLTKMHCEKGVHKVWF